MYASIRDACLRGLGRYFVGPLIEGFGNTAAAYIRGHMCPYFGMAYIPPCGLIFCLTLDARRINAVSVLYAYETETMREVVSSFGIYTAEGGLSLC